MLEEDNRRLRRENIQLTNYQKQIRIKKTKNQEKIKNNMKKFKDSAAKTTQKIIDPLHSKKGKDNAKENK